MSFVTLTRRYLLRAMHNLNNPELNDADNERLYGMCYRTHGHDYQIMVTVEAPIDPSTGIVFSRDVIDSRVNEKIIKKLEGQMLNDLYPNTSGEALSFILFELLKNEFAPAKLKAVTIQETRKNWFSSAPVN
jgi:6-pyruvoyltetrahydropterin/6-carboxytetrahydropterin synthase